MENSDEFCCIIGTNLVSKTWLDVDLLPNAAPLLNATRVTALCD